MLIKTLLGVVAQLVERLICIQEAWGSTPHNSIFLFIIINIIDLFQILLVLYFL
jgi:hypothetical protein